MRCLILCLVLSLPGIARRQGSTSACKSNLQNIAAALEMWASEHSGHYPRRLEQLTPTYIQQIPTCPAARRDTYTLNYRRLLDPDEFGVCCSGYHHRQLGAANLPAYTASNGLAWRPARWSAEPCQRKLHLLGETLKEYRRRHNVYPTKLEELIPDQLASLPTCPAGPFEYNGKGRVSCPGDAHLVVGLSYFQPQWEPGSGTTARPLRLEPELAAHAADNQLNLFTLLGLVWVWGLLRIRRY